MNSGPSNRICANVSRSHVQRGKLECRVLLGSGVGADREIRLNLALLEAPERLGRGGDRVYTGRAANERG